MALGLYPLTYSDLDRALIRTERPATGDVSQIVAMHLPNDFYEAVIVLREAGFEEGYLHLGVITHHRRTKARLVEPNRIERSKARIFEEWMDEHGAILAK